MRNYTVTRYSRQEKNGGLQRRNDGGNDGPSLCYDKGMASKAVALILFSALSAICLTAQTDAPLPSSAVADKVIVLKRERKLLLMQDGKTLKTYPIALGANPTGTKTHQGDHRTPEGHYTLDRHNAHSQYHRSLHISYPNAEDVARAHKLGLSPGGDIFIHGLPNGYEPAANEAPDDWTDGCIAVTNSEIDEIFRAVLDGTPIEIKP
jgi:murein L,D-transpeptidase YafK